MVICAEGMPEARQKKIERRKEFEQRQERTGGKENRREKGVIPIKFHHIIHINSPSPCSSRSSCHFQYLALIAETKRKKKQSPSIRVLDVHVQIFISLLVLLW